MHRFDFSISLKLDSKVFSLIGPLHDPVKYNGTKLHISTGEQVAQCDFQSKGGALFRKTYCATCSPVYVILYHVTGPCKGPITLEALDRDG